MLALSADVEPIERGKEREEVGGGGGGRKRNLNSTVHVCEIYM